MFKKLSLGKKLVAAFLAVGLIPFAIVSIISLVKSSEALSNQAFNQLESVRGIKKTQIERFFAERKGDMGVLVETVGTLRQESIGKLEAVMAIKKNQIEGYFAERIGDASVLSKNDTVVKALERFEQAFLNGGDRIGSSEWQGVENNFGKWLEQYKEEYGYYDLFLISADGDVVFTVAKESDLGQNIKDASLKESPLGRCFQKALQGGSLADFQPYAPSNNEPASFVGSPIKNINGQTIGVVALQIPLSAINKIMQERTGLGETGETYLVGPDKLMRSDSFLDPKNHSVKASFANPASGKVDTDASRMALEGKSGAKVIIDYNGNPVLSAYSPLKIAGINWAIIAEIDVAEAFNPKDDEGQEFFAKYKELYGYYDLFLINPDGYCFYSVAKEADYETNLVNGKYSSSNLGKLVRNVLDTRKYSVADFEPYAPSNDEPAAFIAQPVLNAGKAELVVALQLSLEAINAIMQERDGMGKTGETYLVGPDKLMRSDSFLDPTYHTVKTSFANPSSGRVDTEAAREALSGQTDAKIITDYNGNPVLSAFAPIKVGDTDWALIAEIDESEAFAAVNMIQWLIGIIAIIGIAAITGIALLITRSITKPVNRIIEALNSGAEQVSAASAQVSSASQSLAEGASENAAGLEETSSSLEEMSSMTKQNADNAAQANSLMDETKVTVKRAGDSMQEMTQSMDEISNSGQEISKIIKTIDEIAFQTNLLALNAAVEAARAGEAGQGFAVVADEVRNLAQRAAEAAKNTSELIEDTIQKIHHGNNLVKTTDGAFSEVAVNSNKVAELVGEIAAASQEQAEGITQVNTAMTQMDQVTQQNAANAEESASASEELNAQAESMHDSVAELNTLVAGANANSGHRRSGVQPRPTRRKLISSPKPQQKKNIASARGQRQVAKPNEVIPMDDDFGDF